MTYEKQQWVNTPSTSTPISADRLNHLETQYEEAVSSSRAYTDAAVGAGGNFSDKMAEELQVGSTTQGALQLEVFANSRLLDLPRTPSHVYFGHGVNPKWKEAVSKVKAGTSAAKVLCIGDSTTYGTTAKSPNGYMNEFSWPYQMVEMLNNSIAPTSRGLCIPPSDGSSVPSRLDDSRWVLGTGWVRPSNPGTGLGGRNSTYRGSVGSGALEFSEPNTLANRFDIYYLTNTGTSLGTFQASVPGGVTITVNTGGKTGLGLEKSTVIAPSSAVGTKLSIRNTGTSGNVYIIGVEAYESSKHTIRVANAGSSGSDSADWVVSTASDVNNAWNIFGFLKVYKPDLVIIDLGINDASVRDAAEYMANISRIASAAESEGSVVLFKTMIPSSSGRYAKEASYVSALRASNPPRAVLDLFNHYSYDINVSRGWMADTVHGNESLYADEASLVTEYLYRYSGH